MAAIRQPIGEKFLRRKPVAEMTAEAGTDSGQGELARSMGLFQLTMFGIGATIGTGIFIVLTSAVPEAGPAVVWSFVLAGAVAGLTAICYAELASAVPVSGSSYSYAYATLGEGVAMVVAACLLLEYGVSAAAVAVGWSQYLNELLDNLFGFTIPESLSQAPEAGGVLNLPAMILIGLCALLLIRGASESAKVNAAMVMIKIGVLALFIVLGVQGWNSDNLSDFAPFGVSGITGAAGIIFFSYIGLDAVSTAGEEVRNPRRTMPLAIIISLVVVTGLYVLVAIVAVAAQPMASFEGQEAGLAAILEDVTGSTWPGTVLAAGRGDLDLQRDAGRDLRPDAHPVRDGSRRDGPADLPPREPAHADAGAGDDHRRGGRGAARGCAADQLPRRDDVDRDAGGVPGRLDRRDGAAAHGAGPAARLQGAAVPGRADPLDRRLRLDHQGPALRHDRGVLHLDRRGTGLVLLLRHPSLGAGAGEVIVVGVAPDGSPEALALAGMLARAAGEPVLPVSVVPSPWAPSPARVDAEYQASLAEAARAVVGDGEVVHARSVAAGLLEVAERESARAIVVGSFGSVSNRLLHSSHVPIALAPAGFACGDDCPVRRVTAAFGGSGEELVAIASREAARVGAALRVAAFAVAPRAPVAAGVGAAERGVVSQWEEDLRAAAGVRGGHRPRRDVGRGDRRRAVGGRRRAGRRLQLDRPDRAGLPRLAGGEDRPALTRARRRRAPRGDRRAGTVN